MARLFGLIGNRADLAGRIFHAEAEALRVQSKPLPVEARTQAGSQFGWGIGIYQGEEVLMRRRPVDDRVELDVAQLAKEIRSDLLIAHVRSATVGAPRTENTHPFRYRQWLYAQ